MYPPLLKVDEDPHIESATHGSLHELPTASSSSSKASSHVAVSGAELSMGHVVSSQQPELHSDELQPSDS
jgi:hypothetical protein